MQKMLSNDDKMKLNLGCYKDYREGYINLDKKKYKGIRKPDVIWDLNKFPYPFKDNTFEEVLANLVLEHLYRSKLGKIFEELYRICKNDAIIKIKVPYGLSWIMNIDHKSGFHYDTFITLCSYRDRGWQGHFNFELIEMKTEPSFVGKFLPFRRYFSYFLNNIVKLLNVKIKVIK